MPAPKKTINNELESKIDALSGQVRGLGPAPLTPGARFMPGRGVVGGIMTGRERLYDVLSEMHDAIWTVANSGDEAARKNLIDLIAYRTKVPAAQVRQAVNEYYVAQKKDLSGAKAQRAEKAAAVSAQPVQEAAPQLPSEAPTGEPTYSEDPYADTAEAPVEAPPAAEKIAPTPEKTATAPIETPAAVAPSAPAAGAPAKIDRTAGGTVQIKPSASKQGLPSSSRIFHYTFTLIPQDSVTQGMEKGFIVHSGTPGIDGYPMPARDGDGRTNLQKIQSGERSATTRNLTSDIVPNAKPGDVINVGKTGSNKVYVQLTGKYQVLAFDRRTGLVALKDIITGQVRTMGLREMAAAEGYSASSYAKSIRTMGKVEDRAIPEPIAAKAAPVQPFTPTQPEPTQAPAAATAPSPAAAAAPTPGAAFAPNQDILRKALAIQDPTLKAEILSALLAQQSAGGVPEPQVAPEIAPAALPEAYTAIPEAAPEAAMPETGGVPGPIPEDVKSAVANIRGPKLKVSGVQPSFEDPIENHFINSYIQVLEASHKLAATDSVAHKQIDPGAFENLRVLQDPKARPAAKAEAQLRFLNAYAIRGKFIVSYIMAGRAPGKTPSQAETAMFTKAQRVLIEGLQTSGVSSRAVKLAVDEASGTGLMFGRNLEDWHTSSSTTAVDRAIDGVTAILDHIERNPAILAENADYVPMIQRSIASIVHNNQTLSNPDTLDYNAFYEKGKFQAFNYGDAVDLLKVRAGMWGGLDWGKVRMVLDDISFDWSDKGFLSLSTKGDVAARFIPEVAAAQEPEAISAELKRFIRRIHKTVIAYEYADKSGRRTGIRDFWLDSNGFITPEQRWLDSYGFGPDYALDRAAMINYYPGIENAPAELEPILRDGFRDFTERHPTLFPVYRGGNVRIGEPGSPEYGIGDFATIESAGAEGINAGAMELTRQAVRDLSMSNLGIVLLQNTSEDTVEYQIENGRGDKTTVTIKPGKFQFALTSEIMAERASLTDVGVEIIDVPEGYVTYRPVVNSELAVVNSHTQSGAYRVARASGLGEMSDILENSQEMNGFITLERNPAAMPDSLDQLMKIDMTRRSAIKLRNELGQTMETTVPTIPSDTDGMVSVSVMVGHKYKSVPSGAEAATIRGTGAVRPAIKIDGQVIPLDPATSVVVPDMSAPIYKTFKAPIELFNPNLDPNHPLLQDPQYAFLRDAIERGEYVGQPTNDPSLPDVRNIDVKGVPRIDLQGSFRVQMAGKFPGAPILEGTGTSGDQTVSESVAQQYDSNAEFRNFRQAQLQGKTEGGLPVDETTNILAQPEAFQTPGAGGVSSDRNVRILLGHEMPTSIAEIDSVIAASGMGPESSASVRARLVKNYEYVNDPRKKAKVTEVLDRAARRASSGIRVQPLDALYDEQIGDIAVNPELQKQMVNGATNEQIVARLLQHLLRIEMFSSRKLHYFSVVTDRAPQNQKIEGVRQMTQNIVNFIANRPELRTTLYKAEVARASDVIFAAMSPESGKSLGELVSPSGTGTRSVFTISTNPAIIAYGTRRDGAAQDISIAWQLASEFEQKLTRGFEENMPTLSLDSPRSYYDKSGELKTETLQVGYQEQAGFGQRDLNWKTPPAKRGDTIASLLRKSGFSMSYMESILQDGTLIGANKDLFVEMGLVNEVEPGVYEFSPNAKFDTFLRPGARLSVPVDDAELDARQRSMDAKTIEGTATEVAPAPAPAPVAGKVKMPKRKVDKNLINKMIKSLNALNEQLLVETDPEKKIKLSLDIANRERILNAEIEKVTKMELKAGEYYEPPARPPLRQAPAGPTVPDYKTALANMALRNPERAKRVIELAHNILTQNLATQRTGTFGHIVRMLEKSYANKSKASAIEGLGYIELPETVQLEANPDFVANVYRYPEVAMDTESEGSVYAINDFGPSNKVFNGLVPDDMAESGEIPMWQHVSKYIARNKTMLVYTVDANGVGKFGIMPVITEQSPTGMPVYRAAPSVLHGNGLTLEEMTQSLREMGLDPYVDTVVEVPLPPDIPETASLEQKQQAMSEYNAELAKFIEDSGMTMFDIQVAQGNYKLSMNRDYFNQSSRLHDVPEASLFDGAVSSMFYQDIATIVKEDPRVDMGKIFPTVIVDEAGRILEPTLSYAALANDARNRTGVIKVRTTAGMSVGEKVTKSKVVIGEGHLDLAYLRQANAELAAEVEAGRRGAGNPSANRAQQILDSAIMKAESQGYKYQTYDEPKTFGPNGPESGPTNTAAKFNRYGKGVLRGTAGAVALMALMHEMRYGSQDTNEMASMEGVYNKAASYAPLAATVAGVEGISRLPIPTKLGGTAAAGGLAGAAMLGYTAATGGDILRTAIGLLGGTVAGIGAGLASGGALAMPASIAGGLAADELYAKLTGKESSFDLTPIRSVPKNVAKVETTGDTRSDLESQYTSKGGFGG